MARGPRSAHEAWEAPAPRSARAGVLAALVVAAGIPLGLLVGGGGARGTGEGDSAEAEPPPRPTPNVHVAMHLSEPLVADRTVVWTAAFQAAWDALDVEVRERWRVPRLDLGPPAPRDAVEALAGGRLTPGVVDPKDLTVVAGPATEATWARIDAASDLGRPAGTPPPSERDLAAFARLRASIRYETPFHVETTPLRFGPTKAPVRAYGLEENATGGAADRMRDQVDLHRDETIQDEPARQSVVVLKGADGARVLVSGRPAKSTLAATWNDVAAAVRRIPAAGFSMVDRLAIPRVAIVASRSFEELVGAEIVGVSGSRLAVAREDVRLTADEKGADVDAEAALVAVAAMPLDLAFDGPFLLAMCAKGSDVPYAIAWIGSADGLSPWGEPVGRPLSAREAKPFVGSWALDAERSADATFARWTAALAKEPPSWAPKESDRQGLRQRFAAQTFDVEVAPDGTATIVRAAGKEAPERAAGPLVRDGARVALAVPTSRPSGAREPEREEAPDAKPPERGPREPRGEDRWTVSRDGDRLVLASAGGGTTLVLVRR